jgi:hypothetical protein
MSKSPPTQNFLLSGEIVFVNNGSSIAPQEISLSPDAIVYSNNNMIEPKINDNVQTHNINDSDLIKDLADNFDVNDLPDSTGNNLPKTCFSIFRKGVVNVLFSIKEIIKKR